MNARKFEQLKIRLLEFQDEICEEVNEIIDNRNDLFIQRSDKWQESEKGEEWEEKTSEIVSILQDLDDLIVQADRKIDELIEL